jgi:hypothetical protein
LWAKLNNFPSQPFDSATLISYGPPFAFPQFHWRLGFGSNDGCGGSGLFSTVGVATNAYCRGLVDTATGYRTFDSILGDRAAWHHYAMVWNEAGIAELGGRQLYVYLDGNLLKTPYYHDGSPWNAIPNGSRIAVTYFYHISGASIAVDNLIIWDDVKTDFSHRFNEVPSCDPAPVTVGGAVTGLRTTKAWCINNTTGASVVIPLVGATSWDCEAAGIAVSEGDRLSLRVRGLVTQDATDVGGAVTGMTPSSGGCSNLTTGQSVTFQQMKGATAASCVAAGLVVHPEDSVQMRVQGVAK